jgi:hypothetical protein
MVKTLSDLISKEKAAESLENQIAKIENEIQDVCSKNTLSAQNFMDLFGWQDLDQAFTTALHSIDSNLSIEGFWKQLATCDLTKTIIELAQYRDTNSLKRIFDKMPDSFNNVFFSINIDSSTILYLFLENNANEYVIQLLNRYPENVVKSFFEHNPRTGQAIYSAIRLDQIDIIKSLLERMPDELKQMLFEGANIAASPFGYAVMVGRTDIIKLFIENIPMGLTIDWDALLNMAPDEPTKTLLEESKSHNASVTEKNIEQ